MENQEAPKKKNKVLPIILLVVVIAGGIFGISKYRYAQHHEDTDDAQLDNDISPVISRVTGYVNEIRFEDNQFVRKGDTLVVIDNRDMKIKTEQASAALENARAGVSVAQANVSSAVANLETAKSSVETAKIRVWKSTQDFTRYQNLLADKAVTQQQFDAAKAEKESAEASLVTAQRQQSSATAMVEAAQKQVVVANSVVSQKQADLDFADLQLSYATIIAPADGYASKKNIQIGQLVNAGTSMFAIVSGNEIYVVANFKETQVGKMQKGNSVEVIIDAFPDKKVEGTVASFSAATGAKFSLLPPDNATGNFVKVVQRLPVKIAIKSDPSMKDVLRPGMSAKVSVLVQ